MQLVEKIKTFDGQIHMSASDALKHCEYRMCEMLTPLFDRAYHSTSLHQEKLNIVNATAHLEEMANYVKYAKEAQEIKDYLND
jgi:hypothetical protein